MISGAYLRGLREAKGVSQQAVAKAMHTQQSHVSDLESESIDPRMSTVARYLIAVGQATCNVVRQSAVERLAWHLFTEDEDMEHELSVALLRSTWGNPRHEGTRRSCMDRARRYLEAAADGPLP